MRITDPRRFDEKGEVNGLQRFTGNRKSDRNSEQMIFIWHS